MNEINIKYSVQGSSGCGSTFRPNEPFVVVNRYERLDSLIFLLMTSSNGFTLPLTAVKGALSFPKPIEQNSDIAFCRIVKNRIESISERLEYGICTELLYSNDNKRITAIRVKIANI